MKRNDLERRLIERRDLWRQMVTEARTIKEALTDPTTDPAPAMEAMSRREAIADQLRALGPPSSDDQTGIDHVLTTLDDEIVALMEEVAALDEETAKEIAQALEQVSREMKELGGGRKVARGYGDQKKELFARYMSKKL